jgi:hypothetical protein
MLRSHAALGRTARGRRPASTTPASFPALESGAELQDSGVVPDREAGQGARAWNGWWWIRPRTGTNSRITRPRAKHPGSTAPVELALVEHGDPTGGITRPSPEPRVANSDHQPVRGRGRCPIQEFEIRMHTTSDSASLVGAAHHLRSVGRRACPRARRTLHRVRSVAPHRAPRSTSFRLRPSWCPVAREERLRWGRRDCSVLRAARSIRVAPSRGRARRLRGKCSTLQSQARRASHEARTDGPTRIW